MAMIQFAINSTERKRMTLKDIYTWIEDHFPYFKHMAKPGWKVLCPITIKVEVTSPTVCLRYLLDYDLIC